MSQPSAEQNASPIFVVGLPRTGTTLVERIVACHSSVTSVGESVAFPAAISRAGVASGGSTTGTISDRIKRIGRMSSNVLSESYLFELSRRHDIQPLQRTIDKLPLNYLHVGLIRFAFTNARIIWVKRGVLDTVVALYRTLFSAPYPFTYELEEMTAYLIAYFELEQQWSERVDNLHIVEYEALVTDQEIETRKLLAYCRLEWEASCLSPELSMQPGTTASAVQVRQKVHGNSIDQWRRYEGQLTKTMEQLQRAGLV